MNNMTDQEWIKKSIHTIWNSFYRVRVLNNNFDRNFFYTILYVVYGHHKCYTTTTDNPLFDVKEDSLLQKFNRWVFPVNSQYPEYILELHHNTDKLAAEEVDAFQNNYPYLLIGLFEAYKEFNYRFIGHQSKEINYLISSFIKQEQCKSVYNPFCNTAGFVAALNTDGFTCHYEAADKDSELAFCSMLMVEAYGGNPTDIQCTDVLTNWNTKQFDAIISWLPNKISERDKDCYISFCQLEEEILHRAFERNHAELVIILTHEYIDNLLCIPNDYLSLLDTIIELPSDILSGSKAKGLVLIFKKDRTSNESVRILKLESFYQKKGIDKTFDLNRFLRLDLNHSGEYCIIVPQSELRSYCIGLFPTLLQIQNQELKPKQQRVKLSDLFINPNVLSLEVGLCNNNELVSEEQLYPSLGRIIMEQNKYETSDPTLLYDSYGRFYTSPGKFLLERTYDSLSDMRLYGLHTSGESFAVDWDIIAFQINEQLVIPEYLVYLLLQSEEAFQKAPSIYYCMSMPVIIDDLDKQRLIVKDLKIKYQQKLEEEHEADLKRLGIKQNISDLEHMLGAPQHKIDQIIRRLERIKPDADNYSATIRALRDNFDYMNRLIEYNHSLIDQCNIPEQPRDLSQFIRDYAERWRNYGLKCFELSINDELGDDAAQLRFDETRMNVMLDAILGNAARHGFHKENKPGNHVEISLSKALYNEQSYILLKVSNNGDPMPENFTFDDYISRHRYSAETGRSGLGGYHVYQVVTGHHGKLRLNQNEQWNMIVEILLPLEATQRNI
jgi:signal transduction histidine kinase